MPAVFLLYLFGPSSRQKESVRVASSSKNSVAKASHHKLSLSCEKKNRIKSFSLDFKIKNPVFSLDL